MSPALSPGLCRLSGLGLSSCEWRVVFLSPPQLTVPPRIIAFRFIPSSVISKPVGAVWGPLVAKPFNRLPRPVKLGLGWLALLAIVFGSAFGFPLPQVSCFPRGSGASIPNARGAGNYVWRSCHLRPWPPRLPVQLLADLQQSFPGSMVGLSLIGSACSDRSDYVME